MSEEGEPATRWPRLLARALLGGILLAVLYFLSIGPASYLLSYRSERIDRAVGWFYFPVLVSISLTRAERYLDGYVDWWAALPGGANDRDRRRPPASHP